jgi:hypothetical protein
LFSQLVRWCVRGWFQEDILEVSAIVLQGKTKLVGLLAEVQSLLKVGLLLSWRSGDAPADLEGSQRR